MNLWNAGRLAIVALAVIGVAAGRTVAGRTSDVAVKDRTNAYASVAASGKFVLLAWGATATNGSTDVYVSASHNGGLVFRAPARVNSVAGEANFSGEQPPRIALLANAGHDPAIVVVWTAKGTAGTRLLSARSDNGGASFTPAVALPGSEASGNRGWESTTNVGGSVVAVWLDHRALSAGGDASMNHAGHEHGASAQQKTDGVARAQLSKLLFARLGEAGSAQEIAVGVCYCCKTSLATDTSGGIYAAWRQVYEGNIRDIAFSKSVDGGRTFSAPIRVSDDHWVLDGCPENGPAIAVDQDKRIHVVWPTLLPGTTGDAPPTLGLFYAMSRDGRQFTPRQQIVTEGVPRHPQIALGPKGRILVVFDEQAPTVHRVALVRGTLDANGIARFVRQSVADSEPATYPVVAATASGTVVAWTSGPTGHTVIRTTVAENSPGDR